MGLRSRKGYVHALEGVIAALLVVVYLNSIVTVPETTDWEKSQISKQSEDLLSAMDRSGFLDRTVLRDDRESFAAFTNTLSSSLSYSVKVSGLPKRFIDIGVLVDGSDTSRASSTFSATAGNGVPESVDGSGYREGTLDDQGFDSLDFVLSDTVENGMRGYSSVNVDLDGDGDFDDADEGPHNFSDRFVCDSDVGKDNCTSTETYEVGSFNTTLVVYNASTAASLAERKSGMDIGMRSVDLGYGTVNPDDGSLERFDVLWVEDWTAAEIEGYDEELRDFLRTGRMLLVHSPVAKEDIDSNYLAELGFSYINEYRLKDGGTRRNALYSVHGPRNESYRSAQYVLESGMVVDGFEDQGGYDRAFLEVNTSEVEVRRWPGGEVSFGSESFAANHSEGGQVAIKGNQYAIEGTEPLVLDPSGQHRFASFGTERINADYHATRMEEREYNISDYDTSAGFDDGYPDRGSIPGDYSDGLVDTGCNPADNPYKNGSIEIDGTDYAFMLVNFEPSRSGDCDSYSEFVYFDIARDGDYNEDSIEGSSHEGPYQLGDVVNVSGNAYTVSPHLDGEGVDLFRVGPRIVGEVPVSTNVFGEGGSATVVRRQPLGHDDMHLLASVMARETQQRQSFTARRSLGDTSLGYTYSSSAGSGNSFGYTLETVWWFQ